MGAFSVIIFCLVTTLPLYAAKPLLVVRGEENYPPFEMVDAGGRLSGLHVEMLRAAAESLDVDLAIRSLPWKRALLLLKNGDADAILFVSPTPERRRYITFEPGNILSTTHTGVVAFERLADGLHHDGDIRTLTPYRIGLRRGFIYGDTFDNAAFLQKHPSDSQAELERLLEQRRIDLLMVNHAEYLRERKLGLWQGTRYIPPHLDAVDSYLGFARRPELQQIAQDFARALTEFRNTPRYRELRRRFELVP